MTESFADLFQESMEQDKFTIGNVIKASIVDIGDDAVLVNAGLKSDAVIDINEFKSPTGELEAHIGDEVDVVVEAIEDGFGNTRLSRDKAKRLESWSELKKSFEKDESVDGVIIERVKGGFTVALSSIRAFLPGSLVDVRPVRNPAEFEGQYLKFKIIKMDERRSNIVVSRRAVIEEESGAEREALLEKLAEGQEVKGIVKNITDYGAFVDLGGIDGLLHITDMSWKRIKHPSEMLNVGDELAVKILKFDKEKRRVSLGLKQLGDDPWADIALRYPIGSRLTGVVTNIADYGCFVEIEEGIEGLVHMSEMDWTNKNIHPSKVVQLGQEVEVMVLDIDENRRRISLGLKQCQVNPWEAYMENHEKGEVIKGQIKSITDFGIFIGLEGAIDGLVHLSDISWNETGENAVRNYKKAQEIEAVILSIDPERERISLGIKQMESDPLSEYLDKHEKGSMITCSVIDVDPKRALINLADGVEGLIRASDVSTERVNDVRDYLKAGEEIEAYIQGMDRKNRVINLSMRPPQDKSGVAALESEPAPSNTMLGDLLKEKMEGNEEAE